MNERVGVSPASPEALRPAADHVIRALRALRYSWYRAGHELRRGGRIARSELRSAAATWRGRA